jgi:hypothetical protein
MTPEQQMAFKQAQADMRAQQNAGLTIQQQQERQAQAQRAAGKKVDIPKDPKLQENINRMKAAITPPPPPAIVPVGSSPASSMGVKIDEVKGGQEGVKPGGKIAEIKGGQEGVKPAGKIAEVEVAKYGKMVQPSGLTNVTGPKIANEPVKQKVILRPMTLKPAVDGGMECPPGQSRQYSRCVMPDPVFPLVAKDMGYPTRKYICTEAAFPTLVDGKCHGECPDGYAVNPKDAKRCLLNGAKP